MNPASDYCQRWQDRKHSFRHVSEGGFDQSRYDVAAVGEAAAKAFVEQNHYSGSYPAARLRYGLYERGALLVGVAVLSVPVQRSVLANALPDLEPYQESLELGRFVLADQVPANAESWFLARAFDLAAQNGLRGVVSFSDPLPRRGADGATVFAGHVGTIYQASNAVYTGRGTARWLRLLPNGQVLNERAIQKVRCQERSHEYVEDLLVRYGAWPRRGADPVTWLPQALADAGVQKVWHPGNHRYVFKLGKRNERRQTQIAFPSLPYPKAG